MPIQELIDQLTEEYARERDPDKAVQLKARIQSLEAMASK